MEYWKKVNADGTTRTVERHSFPHKVPDAVKITQKEYDSFIASLPIVEPEPVIDPLVEIDKLEARVKALEDK